MIRDHPLLFVGVTFLVGVGVGDELSGTRPWILWIAAATLCGVAATQPGARAGRLALAGAALASGAAAMGASNEEYARNPLRRAVEAGIDGPVKLTGHAASDLVPDDPRRRFTVAVEEVEESGRTAPWRGRASLRVGGEAPLPAIAEGQRLSLWAVLEGPLGARSPGAADARARARREGIHAFGYVKAAPLLAPGAEGRGVRGWIARARRAARDRLAGAIPGSEERGIIAALTFGDRSGVAAALQEDYRRAGVLHVLAVSGAQVALLGALLHRLLRHVGVSRGAATALLAAALSAYAALAGGEASVLRAALMAVVAGTATAIDLTVPPFNVLGAAVLALVGFDPGAVFDPGFQLSVAATAGLLAFAGPWGRFVPPRFRFVSRLLAASLAAQAAVLPLQIVLFHVVSLCALATNLVAVPLSAALLVGGLAFLVAAAVSPLAAAPLGFVLERMAVALNSFVSWWAGLPGIDLALPTPPPWTLLAYAGGLAGLSFGAPVPRALPVLLAGLAGCLLAGGPRADGRLHFYALDVGQGDALVLVSPRGRVTLVDAGGGSEDRWNAARSVVAPFLWSRGVFRVDRLVLTHAHADHVGAATWLIRTFRIPEVWEGPAARSLAYAELMRSVARSAVGRRTVYRGVNELWDGVVLRVEGPDRPRAAPSRVHNDDSLVLSVAFADSSFLLTGDIEAAAETRLALRHHDVVKVPHHGSRTSSTPALVSGACPDVAFVSVGARNRFRHPDLSVMRRYLDHGVLTLRTDTAGTLHATTDGRHLTISAIALGLWSKRLAVGGRCATIRPVEPTPMTRDSQEGKQHFTVKDRRRVSLDEDPQAPPEVAPAAAEKAPAPPAEAAANASSRAATAPPGRRVELGGFIASLAAQAAALLAEEDHAAEGEDAAREIIAILEMLQDKTEGRRTLAETRILEDVLYQLRMVFVSRA